MKCKLDTVNILNAIDMSFFNVYMRKTNHWKPLLINKVQAKNNFLVFLIYQSQYLFGALITFQHEILTLYNPLGEDFIAHS